MVFFFYYSLVLLNISLANEADANMGLTKNKAFNRLLNFLLSIPFYKRLKFNLYC